MMNFERLRGEVVSRVLDNEHAADEAELFTLTGRDDRTFHQAVARIIPDDDLLIVLTVPAETTSIFITVTDGEQALVRRILANLEEMERDGTSLSTACVVRLEDETLEQHGVAGVTLMPLSVSGILCGMEETFEHQQRVYSFHLVVFLSFAEYAIWKAHGQEQIAAHFDEVDKDLLTFRQSYRSH
jgi:hypothetical protein